MDQSTGVEILLGEPLINIKANGFPVSTSHLLPTPDSLSPSEFPDESFPQLNNEVPMTSPSKQPAYSILDKPLGAARHVRIIGIGAGASGINLLRTLRLNLTNYDVVVYEKNTDVGGTWLENRYPGCRCDVPSHSYQFSWRPKKDWKNFFAASEEICDYLRQVCEEEGLRKYIKTSHQVISARWIEEEARWEIKVRNLLTNTEFKDYAHFLVDGTGILK
jgi:Predicted flavoprotein involved in K+ transport